MECSETDVSGRPGTRLSQSVGDRIRCDILRGVFRAGELLPGERRVADTYGVCLKTVRRALESIRAEGLIVSEPRRGHRVRFPTRHMETVSPLAFVFSNPDPNPPEKFLRRILAEIQLAAAEQGRTVLGVATGALTGSEVAEQLAGTRANGVIVDSLDPDIVDRLAATGLPVVMIDAWRLDMPFDAVVQDGFAGGMLAAAWLVKCGCRRVAYVGHRVEGSSTDTVERFSGAVGGLAQAGLALSPEHCLFVAQGATEASVAAVRALLSRPDPPDGILALWQGSSRAVAEASRQMNLVIGRDIQMVGWSTEEDLAADSAAMFPRDRVPPTVVWSVASLARTAVARLIQRMADPLPPPTLTKIAVALRPGTTARSPGAAKTKASVSQVGS
jgi:GntR family transcriptional regulator, arabinose operon transcriptional repressor